MNRQPLISVCINAYNAAHTIRCAIDSVLSQTYAHLQVIVVDDGSTDDTVEILRSYDDTRLEIAVLETNRRISNANNEALARVRGEYVAHLDADDAWTPEKLETQLRFLQAHPQYDACFCLADMVDEHGDAVEDHRFRAENGTRAELLYRLLTKGNYLCHSSMFAKASLMKQVGDHDLSLLYLHDYDYWLRMVLHGAIYILPEAMVRYRLSTDSNSHLAESKYQAHINETAQVVYRTVMRCDDDLFREAFSAQLRRPELTPTPTRTALEKAFLLLSLFSCLPENRALGLSRLSQLIADKAIADTAQTDFGFTVHDYYALCAAHVFHDPAPLQAVQQDAANEIAALSATLESERAALESERTARNAAVAELQSIKQSKAWRLIAPLRNAHDRLAVSKELRFSHAKDGTKTACAVALYGYFAHNFGDDLFFDTLLRRYPDTLFAAYDANGYAAFFDRYPNARVYDRAHTEVQRVNQKGEDAFEHRLLRHCDAVVHIGGSIYQQIGDWENDLRVREKRIRKCRPFFSISSNFGPFHTEGYHKHWHDRFADSHDICFRDTASAALFDDLAAVRHAPDVLFGIALPDIPTVKGRLFISAVDPAVCDTDDRHRAADYIKTLAAVATRWIEHGGSVCLGAFCTFQNDHGAAQTVLEHVPASMREAIEIRIYRDGNFDELLSAVCESEAVLATRFHAMVLGLIADKPTVPVCYSRKTDTVLDDLGFQGQRFTLSSLCDTDTDRLLQTLRTQPPCDVRAWREAAASPFEKLDAFVSAHSGRVQT